jgi:hypothetical protein
MDKILDALVAGHELHLRDVGGLRRMTLAGAIQYHSDGKFAGVVMAYCALKCVLDRQTEPVLRGSVAIRAGHDGSGMRDGFEFFTYCASTGQFAAADFDDGLELPGAHGRFRWQFDLPGKSYDVWLKPGVLPEAMFTAKDPAERKRVQVESMERWLKDPEALFVVK